MAFSLTPDKLAAVSTAADLKKGNDISFKYFPTNQQALWKLVEERTSADSDSAEVERRIWESFGVDGAIVFTDLAGFTRRTEELGLIHFLEVVYHSQRLLRPIIDEHKGTVIEVVGDSMLLWFDDVDDSINCSVAMQRACAAYNKDKKPADQVLLCLGVGYGRTLKIDNARLAGPQVNVASKLGEDTAEGYEILVSNSVKENATPNADLEFVLTGISFPGSLEVYRVNY
ncbi:MAG: adenylate/guanylate cyclase domain-containing protein [Planctomycetaceae bacterium]|nr:adenylate/guanylate cyclase domain-containing protein [Planctomycetaceae bacterium]